MKEDYNKKQAITIIAIILAVVYILCSLFFLAFFKVFYEFELMSGKLVIILGLSIGAFFTVIIIAYFTYLSIKNSELLWLKQNGDTILLLVILISIIFISLTSTLKWMPSEVKDVISIQWVILGTSITIFFVWHVLIMTYLKKKSDDVSEAKGTYQSEYDRLNDKVVLVSESNTFSGTIIMLAVNLLSLVLVTALVYLANGSESVVIQNFIIISFCLSAHSIVRLFWDIIVLVLNEKNEIKKMNKISNEELKQLHLKAKIEMQVEKELMQRVESGEIERENIIKIKDEIIENVYRDMNKQ